MISRVRRRFYFVLLVIASLGVAVALALFALDDNIAFFYAPREVSVFQTEQSPRVAVGQRFRLGGIVKEGSLAAVEGAPALSFVVTDTVDDLTVEYMGLLPDLFREGQGVVAIGALRGDGVFVATEILAKHDENYMPPEVAKTLDRVEKEKSR